MATRYFIPGKLYKHKDNKDVAIEIVKSIRIGPEVSKNPRYKLKITWWNTGPHPWFSMNITQRIEIPIEKIKEWEHAI